MCQYSTHFLSLSRVSSDQVSGRVKLWAHVQPLLYQGSVGLARIRPGAYVRRYCDRDTFCQLSNFVLTINVYQIKVNLVDDHTRCPHHLARMLEAAICHTGKVSHPCTACEDQECVVPHRMGAIGPQLRRSRGNLSVRPLLLGTLVKLLSLSTLKQ